MENNSEEKHDRKKKSKGEIPKLLKMVGIAAALFVATGLIVLLAKNSPENVEKIYSNGFYLYVSTAISYVTSIIPFSLAEVVLYALVIAMVVIVVLTVIQILDHKFKLYALLNFAASILLFVAVFFCQFYVLWGLNHYRVPLETTLGMDVTQEYDTSEVYDYCNYLVMEANTLRETLNEDEKGVYSLESTKPVREEIKRIYKERYAESGEPYRRYMGNAKQTVWANALSYFQVSGMYIPYTAEATVNASQPSILVAFSMAHEYAHYIGYAGEDEANYLGYKICMQSQSPDVKYSGYMFALVTCASYLSENDEQSYTKLKEQFSEGVVRDLEAYSAYWEKYNGKAAELSSSINDAYLSYNNQNGIDSYADCRQFLLCDYFG